MLKLNQITSQMSLEAQSTDRKSRLAALRNKRKLENEEILGDESKVKTKTTENSISIKSRNFDQENKKELKGFDAPPTIQDENSETVEAVSQKIQAEVLSRFREKSDITSLGMNGKTTKSKSLTWDLKRDIQDDLDFLEERTDDALRHIVKERIKKLRNENHDSTN